MITSHQVQKLQSDRIMIMKARYYKRELRYLSRHIEWAIWRHKQELEIVYGTLKNWQHKILLDILNDYTVLGFSYTITQPAKNKNILTIIFDSWGK